MGFLQNILGRVGYFPRQESIPQPKKKASPDVSALMPCPVLGHDFAPSGKEDYLNANLGWVYACTRTIADEIANMELKLFRYKGDKVEEIFEHPLLDLLYKVNNFTTREDHFYLTQTYLELTGEAPWYLELDGAGIPQNIILLRPDRLTIKFDKDNLIGGYEYKVDDWHLKSVQLKPEELILIKYPNPTNIFRGQGTLTAAAKTVNIDNYAEDWNKKFFENSARPDIILTTEQKLPKRIITSLRQQWYRMFRGPKNQAKLAIMHSGLEVKPLSPTAKDMDFLRILTFGRDKICAIFGVPKSIIGIVEDSNRANSETSAYTFAKYTVRPKMLKLVAQLNEFLVPRFGDDLYLDFTDPVPENMESKIKLFESGISHGYLSPNEVREELGRDTLKDGDKYYIMGNLVATEAPPPAKPEKPPAKILHKELYRAWQARNLVGRKKEARKKIKKIERNIAKIVKGMLADSKKGQKFDVEKYESLWRKQISVEERYEIKFKELLQGIFKKQQREVLSRIKSKAYKKALPEDALLDKDAQVKLFMAVFPQLLEELAKEQGQGAVDELGLDNPFDFTEAIRKALRKHIAKFAGSVNGTTNEALTSTLSEGIDLGEGIPKLRKRVQEVFADASKTRAEAIARTETSHATNYAQMQAYIQNGIEKKVWFSALDERTCAFCLSMHGKVIGVKEKYFNLGDSLTVTDESGKKQTMTFDYEAIVHPDLHTNCRCLIAPYVE